MGDLVGRLLRGTLKEISTFGLLVMMFLLLFLLGVFSSIGLSSPLVSIRSEHQGIAREIQWTNYLLSECLRNRGECPKLARPRE